MSGQLFLACVHEAGSDIYPTEMKLTHPVLLFQEAFFRTASETCAVLAEVLFWEISPFLDSRTAFVGEGPGESSLRRFQESVRAGDAVKVRHQALVDIKHLPEALHTDLPELETHALDFKIVPLNKKLCEWFVV
jgi:hypothetical protein